MTLPTVNPAEAQAMIARGARLVDIRAADEHARERIPGALCLPLGSGRALPGGDEPVVFHCRSGARTSAQLPALTELAGGRDAYLLGGGLEAWRKAGAPVERDRSQPLELMRQVQITAGLLVLAGVILALLVDIAFLAIAGFVGAGLTFAGLSGWCGMALLLQKMPWNRRAALA